VQKNYFCFSRKLPNRKYDTPVYEQWQMLSSYGVAIVVTVMPLVSSLVAAFGKSNACGNLVGMLLRHSYF